VRDGARFLGDTLPALQAALPSDAELIVCDDASRDGSAAQAQALGARVIRSDSQAGPAAARNCGARSARGSLLVFVDADVRVGFETLARLLAPFDDPGVAATFGSYDDAPPGPSWVSRYKNLAHHFVHQRSRAAASTFWAGCGAVRRDVFLALAGFDEGYRRASIEDVELGYRLRAAGHRIRLVREAQATHLKQWTLASWLISDLRDRARPWAGLLREGRGLPADLNFTWSDRAATLCVGGALLALAGAAWLPRLAGACALLLATASVLDAPFLAFVARRVSPGFAVAAAALQLAHRAAAVIGLGWGLLAPDPASRERSRRAPATPEQRA
jgi:GT2 family glycosyltransferase